MRKALAQSLKQLNNMKKQQIFLEQLSKQPVTTTKEEPKLKRTQSSSSSASVVASTTLFKNMNFNFPIVDFSLSNKVIEILKKRITKHGGKIFDKNQKQISQSVNTNKLKKAIDNQNLYFCCLDFGYINDCLSENTILSQDSYFIDKLKQQSKISPNKTSKSASKTKDTKIQPKNHLKRSAPEGDVIIPEKGKRIKRKNTNSQLSQELSHLKSEMPEQSQQVIQLNPIDLQASRRRRNQEYWDGKKDKFLCQKGTTVVEAQSAKTNNIMIMDQLKKLLKIYQIQKDKGRVIAYSKAISVIKGLTFDITDAKDVQNIEGIGQKLRDKIKELLKTGKLEKIQKLQKNQKYGISQQLQRVWGIGPIKAVQLYNKGIRSIEQLRKHEDLLNKNQKIGLKYLEQFQQRIPREQVQQIESVVRKTLCNMVTDKTIYKIQTCGSYRRGKQTCGDIDVIITRLDGFFEKDLLTRLIQKLQQVKLITDVLNMPRDHKQQSSLTFMGVCKLPEGKLHRRIDIKYYPLQEFAFALLYFTGSDMFNRSLRLFARKKGYSLSDHRMIPVDKDGKQKKWEGSKIICFEQKDIFDFLGVDYKEPKDRDV